MAERKLREARAEDHAAFERLFPELAVDDPPIGPERFVRELMPTILVVEAGDDAPEPARVVGYAYFQLMKDLAYVRHLVTAPEARQTGVGRSLMEAVAERARAAGCTSWCLNVKPQNTAAIALYRRIGLAPAFESRALKIAWSVVDASPRMYDARITARTVAAEDDARVETVMNLMSGQLEVSRAIGGRIVMGLFDDANDGAVLGVTVFDPSFPGAYPFRAARPELAMDLLRAIRPHARPSDDTVNLVTEGQLDVADALVAAGATVKLEILHMKGALPAA